MKDTSIKGNGKSSIIKAPSDMPETFEAWREQLLAGQGYLDVQLNTDTTGANAGCNEVGTALNKANLLPDSLVKLIGLVQNDPTLKDAIAALYTLANNALPKTGGSMTGSVAFPAGANPALMFNGPVATLAKVSADEDNSILFRSSVLSDEKAALMLILRKDGANTTHYLYGTHNKPSPSDIGAAQMINGSYVGTGTYGEDNPCTITTPFAPKLVIVQDSEWANNMVFVRPHTLAFCPDYSSTDGKCTVTWSDAGLSWYNGNKDGTKTMRQFNDNGKTYYYTAIG